ncbi:hypothetical protein PG999_010726 [Apiospora kogelbergensis]|uniref:Uncharacterized protein n=1 Tax=Apiospora kogelbergensis TaxID=1337665 RepID=A0AAW0QCG9_9PEZI
MAGNMAGNSLPRVELYEFDYVLTHMDEFKALLSNEQASHLQSNHPPELLSFDESLLRGNNSATTNNPQGQQNNGNTGPLPTAYRPSLQRNTMAHGHGDASSRLPASHPNLPLHEGVTESSPHDTPMTGVMNTTTPINYSAASDRNSSNNLALDIHPTAVMRDDSIETYLDSLPDVELPSGKNSMGGHRAYDPRRRFGRHAMALVVDADSDEDRIPMPNPEFANHNIDDSHRYQTSDVRGGGDNGGATERQTNDVNDGEPILDCIVVPSDSGSEATHRGDGRATTAGTDLENSIVIPSDDESSSDVQVTGVRRRRQGNDDYSQSQHISISSSSSSSSDPAGRRLERSSEASFKEPSEASSEDDDIEMKDAGNGPQEKKEKPPAHEPAALPEQEQEPKKCHYFATGVLMDQKKMKAEFPEAKYLCLAKLKGYRWLICGPRRRDLPTINSDNLIMSPSASPPPGSIQDFVLNENSAVQDGGQDPEGYATIAPVYRHMHGINDNIGQKQDLEGSCVYGALYEVSEAVAEAIRVYTMGWSAYSPLTVSVIPLERDLWSVEPEMAGTMPLALRELEPIPEACTYVVDSTQWHMPWRAPDWKCGGTMELGRVRDHERAAMIPYMKTYNADYPHFRPPYPLPEFARLRRDTDPVPLSADLQPRVYDREYMDALRSLFHTLLFDRFTPLWYVNEALRPWVQDLEWWPMPHQKWELHMYPRSQQ